MFNPDGSLKLPGHVQKSILNEEQRMEGKCIRITKNVISESPKRCHLDFELGKRFEQEDFVANIVSYHNSEVETPIRAENEDGKWKIVVGTGFRRCSDCAKLIRRFRSFANGNLILKQGSCPYELDYFDKNFAYEDYFE